jgi:hypothetical protein
MQLDQPGASAPTTHNGGTTMNLHDIFGAIAIFIIPLAMLAL